MQKMFRPPLCRVGARGYFLLSLALFCGFSVVILLAFLFRNSDTVGAARLVSALTTVLLFLFPAMAWLRWHGQGVALAPVQRGVKPLMRGLLAMLIALPMASFLSVVSEMLPWPDWALRMDRLNEEGVQRFISQKGSLQLFMNLLSLAVIPAVCEEYFFRGVLQRMLIVTCRNEHVGVLIGAALFSLAHLSATGFAARLVLGLTLGYFYLYTGNLTVSILMHLLNNVLALLFMTYWWPDGDPVALNWWLVASALLCGILLFVLLNRARCERQHLLDTISSTSMHSMDNQID